MTVAVSIAGGIAAITSAYHGLIPHTILLCLIAVAVLTIVNLRGVRESGAAFSVPTYVFVLMMVGLIAYGGYRAFFAHEPVVTDGLIRLDPVSVNSRLLAALRNCSGYLSARFGRAASRLRYERSRTVCWIKSRRRDKPRNPWGMIAILAVFSWDELLVGILSCRP